jgi:hypothetical protein
MPVKSGLEVGQQVTEFFVFDLSEWTVVGNNPSRQAAIEFIDMKDLFLKDLRSEYDEISSQTHGLFGV